jgi:hypothetical protein
MSPVSPIEMPLRAFVDGTNGNSLCDAGAVPSRGRVERCHLDLSNSTSHSHTSSIAQEEEFKLLLVVHQRLVFPPRTSRSGERMGNPKISRFPSKERQHVPGSPTTPDRKRTLTLSHPSVSPSGRFKKCSGIHRSDRTCTRSTLRRTWGQMAIVFFRAKSVPACP